MTILDGDIRLMGSAIMADVDEGGGGPSGTEIADGKSNQMFNDVSEVDRAGGAVSIRQLHMQVVTPDVETLLDGNVIVSRLPTDPNVGMTLVPCSTFARRTEIAQAVADYLTRASEWAGFLLENHVLGQRNITIFARVGTTPPPSGRTLVLVYDEGKPTERLQYVRVTRSTAETRTFSYSNGGSVVDFQADVITCELSDALRFAFPGSAPSRLFARESTKTMIRDTQVADAARYYGAAQLTVAGHIGARVLKVASVYSPLAPSSRTETVATDQRPGAQRSITLATSPREVVVGVTPHSRRIAIGQENRGYSYVGQLKPMPAPGTLVISYFALGNRYEVSDNGLGEITGAGAGTINYITGSLAITLRAMPDAGTAIVISYGERGSYTDRSAQVAGVRAPEYGFQLHADGGIVAGTAVFQWTSGGVLCTASAAANGTISGDATGRMDHPTGQVYMRLAKMIDAGGEIRCEFQRADLVTDILTATTDAGGFAVLNLSQVPAAGTLAVQWATAQTTSTTSGGSLTSTASDKDTTVASGKTTSVATVQRPAGTFNDQYLKVVGTDGAIKDSFVTDSTGRRWPTGPFIASNGGGLDTPGETEAAVVTRTTVNGSSSAYTRESTATSETTAVVLHTLTDDGAGAFLNGMGAIDYAGKQLNIKLATPGKSTTGYKADSEGAKEFSDATTGDGTSSLTGSSQKGGEWGTASVGDALLAGSSIVARYRTGSGATQSGVFTYTPPGVDIDLCPYTSDRIVPGSVQFTWMGTAFRDVDGVLYRGWTDVDNGIVAGRVDYSAGLAYVTDYLVAGLVTDFSLQSLWTTKGQWRTASVFVQVQAIPVAPAGFTMFLIDVAGEQLTATADVNGNLTGDHVLGVIDFKYGLAQIQFGDFVTAATLSDDERAEWWYDPDQVGVVQPGKIWRPWPVDPSTLRYNAVTFTYLPIDADILGLDPVRLPADGLVPIYRPGGFVVIGHSGFQTATPGNGVTLSMGRTRLSRIRVRGADDQLIHTGYSVDLDAGMVKVDDPSTWLMPVTVEHRIEQMLRVSDVQIDGTVTLTGQLSHEYPVGSVLSSALVGDDLWARAGRTFDQATWDGITWADAPVGNVAPGTYNDALFPIGVTNDGAVTERFALRILSNTSTFECIGEHVGNLGQGSINTDYAPNNPRTGKPYFTLKSGGWGGGWAAGNTLRFNTTGAMLSFAAIRTVQPSSPVAADYEFEILARGSIDKPPGKND